jgi:hypothetical protein
MLKSVPEIIDALGGSLSTANLAKVTRPAVSNWKHSGFIPMRLYFVFSEELERRGFKVDRAVFGQPDEIQP